MAWHPFGVVCALLWAVVVLAAAARNLRRPFAALARTAAAGFPAPFVLFVCAAIATVEAQKTNSPPLRMVLHGPPPPTVSAEEIARGYQLAETRADPAHSYAMPTNAAHVGNWHVHGAHDDWRWLDLSPFAFPLGPGDAAHSLVFLSTDARLRPVPHDATNEICAVGAPLLAVPGASALWTASDDADGHPVVTWENLYPDADTNTPVCAQIELFANGDFIVRTNAVVRVFRRIDPCDWDGDGLANAIDPMPTAYGGDCHGTGVAWLNANCGGVLAAEDDGEGGVAIGWHDGVCTNAYYWLEFAATRDRTRIAFVGDGASDLGDLEVIANSNQVCRVPLLAGVRYEVAASAPLAEVSASAPQAQVESAANGGTDADFTVELPVEFSIAGTAPDFDFATVPFVNARLLSVSGGCCAEGFDLTNLVWNCSPGCACGGFEHQLRFHSTWEGYVKPFDWALSCTCQEANKTDPNAWFALECPSLLMKNGNSHEVAGAFDPPCATNATMTLSCIAGAERIAVVESNEWRQVVQGVVPSGDIGDVAFELRLELDGSVYAKTQTLTVAEVAYLHLTSTAAEDCANPPPFDGETACPFSVTNSPNPDRHLVIPFYKVADTNDFSVNDFAVDLRLELNPDVTQVDGTADWTIVENTAGSGSLANAAGLGAQFVNPKCGGIVRFRAAYDGSPATEANLVLPLSGAGVDAVMAADLAAADNAIAELNASTGPIKRQWPGWGIEHFVVLGMGDYVGRVDSAARPTVWFYNQVEDHYGYGAVATWHGVPVRVAKMSDFMVGYACESLGIWHLSQWLSQLFGQPNDESAAMSWAAGVEVAGGAAFDEQTAALATNAWPTADLKTRRLWPNPAAADNHRTEASLSGTTYDFNFIFVSPGFLQKGYPQ